MTTSATPDSTWDSAPRLTSLGHAVVIRNPLAIEDVTLVEMKTFRLSSSIRSIRDQYIAWRYGRIDPGAPIGRKGEQAAARLLRQKGLVVVSESESDRAGEIDIVAADKKQRSLIFVEVKTLQTQRPGHPAERVDDDKQARITRAALRFLRRRKLLGTPCRFDVIAIWWPQGAPVPDRIEHYEHAFEAAGDFQMWS